MFYNQLGTFTDRQNAYALFEHLRGRDPNKPWPLLPILTFIAPGGGGKSMLLEYLRVKRCLLNGRTVVPYVHLDFTQPEAPKDLLSILITFRDQLHLHTDEQNRRLTFPRFDLGASIVKAFATEEAQQRLARSEIQRQVDLGLPVFRAAYEMGEALGNLVPIIPPLFLMLKWGGQQIKPVHQFLQQLESGSGWKWYRAQGSNLGLHADATINDVLLQLYTLSLPGRLGNRGRDYLIEHVLPAAFLEDIRDMLACDSSVSPKAWQKEVNVVLFLDGFEALLNSPEKNDLGMVQKTAGILLLEMLTESRKAGLSDPLLLVVGSRQRLFDSPMEDVNPPFEPESTAHQFSSEEYARRVHERWYQQLPPDRRFLRLEKLWLPMWLHDFRLADTREYITKVSQQEQQSTVNEDVLAAIHSATHGHPLFLALAISAVHEARAYGRELTPDQFEQVLVSPEVVRGYQDQHIADYLLSLLLSQLPKSEQTQLILCAAARAIDTGILQIIMQQSWGFEAQECWHRYRRYTFTRALDNERIVFHPIVRHLLLQRLSPSSDPDSDYTKCHEALKAYFHQRAATRGQENKEDIAKGLQARIEEAYHALALGNPEPAIMYGTSFIQRDPAAWEMLLEAVAEAPVGLLPKNAEQRAVEAFERASIQYEVYDSVIAIILYRWLLSKCKKDKRQAAHFLMELGISYHVLLSGDRQVNFSKALTCHLQALEAYIDLNTPFEVATVLYHLGNTLSDLPSGDQQTNLELAIRCYEGALFEVFTREAFPKVWGTILNNLGLAWGNLLCGDRRANLEKAISYFEQALQVRTREVNPFDWAITQHNLGEVYRNMPYGDRQANLEKAIAHYEAALLVRAREVYPFRWAMTMNNLGIAYRALPRGDQRKNLEKAAACCEAALQVRTRETYPFDWAGTQVNLGNILLSFQDQDRPELLRQAILHYELALEVYSRESFPSEWASVQIGLGNAYCNMRGENRQENVKKAIDCYESALRVWTKEVNSVRWAMVLNSLGMAYRDLPDDQQTNLEQAIACFEAAVSVQTQEMHSLDWATSRKNLGDAYASLKEDCYENLKKAISNYVEASQVFTREGHPLVWAELQNDLGHSYTSLPGGDRLKNLERAIEYHKAALKVYTQETHPFQWASTQNDLRLICMGFPTGDHRVNLEKAISYCLASLQVYTREGYPADWAGLQADLGVLYCNLAEGELQGRLREGIACFEATLQVWRLETHPSDWAKIQANLGLAYSKLKGEDFQDSLKKAIAHYQQAYEVFTALGMYSHVGSVMMNWMDAQDIFNNMQKMEQ